MKFEPKMEIIRFGTEDILTTSGVPGSFITPEQPFDPSSAVPSPENPIDQ